MTALRVVFLVSAFIISQVVNAAAVDAVWAPNPLVAVYDGLDYAAKNDDKCTVTIAGSRNGSFSGQAVFFTKAASKGDVATVSDLKQSGGKGTIPATSVKVRYAWPTGVNGTSRMPAGVTGIFDALGDTPYEKETTAHPIWVTVSVPADAAPGDYEGQLTMGGKSIPVKISVAAWTMPKPEDFLTIVDFIESPESVSLYYEVPLWSDKHFELMGSCFAHLGKVGNKTLFVPLAISNNLGDEHTMIRWIKTDKEKEFKHDFVPFEKYLDVAIKNGMKPKIVVAHVYEDFYGGSQGKGGAGGVVVSLLDPATGNTTMMEGPGHNNQIEGWTNYPGDHFNFWKPVVDGMVERMKARGIEDSALGFGLSRDMMPGKATVENLKKVAPFAGWVSHAHGVRPTMYSMRAAYCTTVWNARFPKDASERLYGWKRKEPVLHNDRDIWKPAYDSQLVRSRILGELNIAGQQRGFGRMSADFWPCLKDAKGNKTRSISSRFPKSDWVQLNLRQTPYLYPGPKGALSTIRFEMLREGIQECEARIYLEKMLLDSAQKTAVGEELAGRCQAVLDDRIRAMLGSLGKGKAEGLVASDGGYANSNWQELSAKLYASAAEVAGKIGK